MLGLPMGSSNPINPPFGTPLYWTVYVGCKNWMMQTYTCVYRPADEFQPNDEVLSVSVRSTETWNCARTWRDRSHLVSEVERLHSRVVSWTRSDVLCNAHSPLPVTKSQTKSLHLLYRSWDNVMSWRGWTCW